MNNVFVIEYRSKYYVLTMDLRCTVYFFLIVYTYRSNCSHLPKSGSVFCEWILCNIKYVKLKKITDLITEVAMGQLIICALCLLCGVNVAQLMSGS